MAPKLVIIFLLLNHSTTIIASTLYTNVTERICISIFTDMEAEPAILTVTLNNNETVLIVIVKHSTTSIVINPGNAEEVVFADQSLTFCRRNVTKSFAGIYRVLGGNDISTLFVLDKPQKAEIILQENGIVGILNASLRCTSNSTSRPYGLNFSFVWKANSVELERDSKYAFSDDRKSVLFINTYRNENQNEYTCRGVEKFGQLSDESLSLSIEPYYGPNSVVLSPSLPSYTVNETAGSVGPIICTADCRPNCVMTWSGPNLPSDTTSVLTLQNINRNQTGDYQCTASNSFGSFASGIVKVIVNYGPNSVMLLPSILSYTVTEGSGSIRPITCAADCRPNCIMTWSGPYLPGDTISVLYLHNINRNLTGNYYCRANNSVSSLTSRNVSVIVYYRPGFVMLNPQTSLYTVNETSEIGPITCTADCLPKCTMAWNGPNLPDGTSLLTLQNISRNQAGDYNCTANNSIGTNISAVVTIVVNYNPTIISIGGNTTYYENDTAEWRCHVDSFPESLIHWTFIDGNNNTIISKDNKSFHKVNRSVLKVYSMSCLSMGSYRCEADNGIGTTQESLNVAVMCSPRLNTIEYEILDRIAVREKESLNITVPILAYPCPWLYWQFQKNQHYTNMTDEVTNRHFINRHTSSIFIHNMEEENFGTYIIYGGNGIDKTNYQIGSFYVVEARRPDLPTSVVAVCKSSSLIIIWRSGFNGGDIQIFLVELTNSATGDKIVSDKITDPGYNKNVQFSSDALTADSNYEVIVKSTNIYGQSNSTTNVTCKSTAHHPSNSDASSPSSFPVGFGTGFGVAVIISIVIVVILAFIRIKRKRNSRPASSKLYEETRSKSEPANIYNEMNQITKEGKYELITRRSQTDIPNKYDDVMTYDNQVIRSEEQKEQTKRSTSTKIGGGMYMNTEI